MLWTTTGHSGAVARTYFLIMKVVAASGVTPEGASTEGHYVYPNLHIPIE